MDMDFNNERKISENKKEISDNIELELFNKLNIEKYFTVDRFEGQLAVLEDRNNNKTINIDKKELPKDIKEGSILKYSKGEFTLDKEKTKEIEQRIKGKMDRLWK